MCDYSLHLVATRPARVGEKLVCKTFPNTFTRGFAAIDDPDTAVCLSPGTELAFDSDVQYGGVIGFGGRTASPVARFCQVNVDNPQAHHDALEFPDGCIVSLQKLARGQIATVLQLPSASARGDGTMTIRRTPAVNGEPNDLAIG